MPSQDACRREIEELHGFFVDWYAGALERAAFARMDDAIGPDFELVTPGGTVMARGAVLDMVRDGYGRSADGSFDIEIRAVELIRALDERALVRYEEWQREGGPGADAEGRISTVLLATDEAAPRGLRWEALHETTIPEERR